MTRQTTTIQATVNGVSVSETIPVRWTLAELIRDRLGLTGTKLSCGMQVCGVCTVLVDGRPVSSCSFLAVDADGTEISTIEGLANGSELHPIQEAFVENFALQCGFCTPGFIMMAKALLDENPTPDRAEVVEYLDGNICRCTGYEPIIRAILQAAEGAGR